MFRFEGASSWNAKLETIEMALTQLAEDADSQFDMSTGTSITTNQPNHAQESWHSMLCLGAQEVLEMMAGTQLTPCADDGRAAISELSAVVGLAGPICGVLTVCCSQKAALLIASRMLGTSLEDAQRELLDAMGEICNMVAGDFKSKLGEVGQRTLLSVPAVIKGTQYRICSAVKGEIIESHQEFDGELIMFRLEYKVAPTAQ